MTTIDGKHFGHRLREARISAGFSQSELEELSGIPKARLSRYENGHVEPSIQTLARLAGALKVSEASLLGDRRAILETFFDALAERGVRIDSAKQGVLLANAVADMVRALDGMEPLGADGLSDVSELLGDVGGETETETETETVTVWADASAAADHV
jgi:transcriptional regulator with XRE-family HTH domain